MKACPRIRFRRSRVIDPGFVGMQIAALDGKREVGAIFARIETDGDPYVSFVAVDPGRCREGIATALYEKLARAVCIEFRRPLTSDTERTAATQAFWEKQVAKGRAVCVGPGEPSGGPAIKDPTMAATGRGGCLAYKLNSCKVTDLSGRKRLPRQPRR